MGRCDTEALGSIFHGHPLFLDAGRAPAPRVEQPDAGLYELLEILVARNDHDIDRRRDSLPGQCSDHVVGFISRQRKDRNTVRLEQLADPLHARVEIGLELLGQLLASRLVRRVSLVAEAESGIVYPAQILRAVRGHEPLEKGDDPPCGGSVLAAGRRERAGDEREERAIDQRVSIDEKEPRRIGAGGGRRNGERGIGHGGVRRDGGRCAKHRGCAHLAIRAHTPMACP